MRIYPFCYVCPRDWRLFENLLTSWERVTAYPHPRWFAFYDRKERDFVVGEPTKTLIERRERPDHFHPWCGWPHAMSKLEGWRMMVADPYVKDSDYVLYCDSDTYFWSAEILEQLDGFDFIGFPHSEYKDVAGLQGRSWSWLSGCFQAARAGMVRDVVNLDYRELDRARQELLFDKFSHNEDVVMSYLFAKCGAKENRLDPRAFMEDRVEQAFKGELANCKSFSHFNHGECDFLGTRIKGKWEIPLALDAAGISV